MSDKSRKLFPVSVKFSAGDQPTHTKLNDFASQTENAFGLVERALGDLWNQSGDSWLGENYPNYQTNLARLFGAANLLSPKVFSGQEEPGTSVSVFSYKDLLVPAYLGETTAFLKYSPIALIDSDFTPPMGTEVFNLDDLGDPGDHWFRDGQKIYFNQIIPPGLFATYETSSITSDKPALRANLIPDPRCFDDPNDTKGLKIRWSGVDGSTGYTVTLPPRFRPEDDSVFFDEPYALRPDISAPNVGIGKYWADTLGFDDDVSQRYLLPETVRNLADGAYIPDNHMYIWDRVNKQVVLGLTFKMLSGGRRAFEFEIETPNINDFEANVALIPYLADTDVDNLDHYTDQFSLICTGTSAAESDNALWDKFINHNHSGSDSSSRIPHAQLDGLLSPGYHASLNPEYPNSPVRPQFLPSSFASDDHSGYLHRVGYAPGRDLHKNAMIGDLLIGSIDSTDDFLNRVDDSYSLYFGRHDDATVGDGGPRLFFDQSHDTQATLLLDEEVVNGGNVDGVLSLENYSLRLRNTLRNEAVDDRVVNLFFGGSPALTPIGGVLRHDQATESFIFGHGETTDYSTGASLVSNRGVFGEFANATLTNGELFSPLEEDYTSLVATSAGVVLTGSPTGGDISAMFGTAFAGDRALRLNKAVDDAGLSPTHTVVDGPIGSFLYLSNHRLHFGDTGTESHLTYQPGPDEYEFVTNAFVDNTTVKLTSPVAGEPRLMFFEDTPSPAGEKTFSYDFTPGQNRFRLNDTLELPFLSDLRTPTTSPEMFIKTYGVASAIFGVNDSGNMYHVNTGSPNFNPTYIEWDNATEGDQILIPIELPDGATLTQVDFYTHAVAGITSIEVGIQKHLISRATGQLNVVPIDSAFAAGPGTTSLTSFSGSAIIGYEASVNTSVSYMLYVTDQIGDGTFRFSGATIFYEMDRVSF